MVLQDEASRTGAATWREPAHAERLRYLPQLDGLRGVAVLLVMVHHALTSFGGWIGVYVFFTLSGYLITRLLVEEHRATGRVRLGRFYLRRLLRLYPPLLTAMAVLLPLGLVAAPDAATYLRQNVVAAGYATNIYGLVTGQGIGPWAHTWTLALEEQFYLVWPFVFLLAFAPRNGRMRALVLVVLGLASLVLATHSPFSGDPIFNPLLTSGGLLLGCALALTRSSWSKPGSRPLVGAAGAGVLVCALVLASVPSTAGFAQAATVLGTLLLLAHLTTGGGAVGRLLSRRPVVLVGRISYELYLWHYALLIMILAAWPGHYRPTVALAYIGALAGAVLSRRFVSTPLNRRFKARLVSSGS